MTRDPDDVRVTLAKIVEIMNRDAVRNPDVMVIARKAAAPWMLQASDPESRDYAAMYGVWRWIRENIAFVMDTHDGKRHHEVLADCENILRMRAGDCDEHTILAGAMLRSLGFRSRIRGIDGKPHNQVEVWVGGPFNPAFGCHVPAHVFIVGYTYTGRGVIVDSTLDRPFGTLAGDAGWQFWLWNNE